MAENDDLSLRPGTRFGRYQIVRRIGRGGMGAVYEGIHVELSKKVAIKALLAPLAENTELRTRFLREGQAASRIRHPHVVDIYDVGTHRGITFLVMEFLEGEELGARLRREGKLSAADTVAVMLPVAAAMSAAHEEGVIHRDLKPANIFLSRDRYGEVVPKVLDFGISKRIDDAVKDGLTNTGALMGTPYYMSPEQATGERVTDARVDQYALGVLLYQCLTGRRPIEGDTMYAVLNAIVEGKYAPPRSLEPSIPVELEDVVLRAMRPRPGERFPDVHALGQALFAFGDDATRARWARQFDTSGLEGSQKLTQVIRVPEVPREPISVANRDALIVGDTPLDRTLTPIESRREAALAEPAGDVLGVTQSRPEALHPPASSGRGVFVKVAIGVLFAGVVAAGVLLALRESQRVVIIPDPRGGAHDQVPRADTPAKTEPDSNARAGDAREDNGAREGKVARDDPAARPTRDDKGARDDQAAQRPDRDTKTGDRDRKSARDDKAARDKGKTSRGPADREAGDDAGDDDKPGRRRPAKVVPKGANDAPILE